MADTYSQIYIHVVFATQGRQNLIPAGHKEELYKYIAGILRNLNQKLLIIGGMPDHVHLFINVKPDVALSDVVRVVKAQSSKFINEKRWFAGKFNWQRGYGAFSYSYSQLPGVIHYIQNQEKHHAKSTFREEYIKFLKLFHVEYDNRYVFEWNE